MVACRTGRDIAKEGTEDIMKQFEQEKRAIKKSLR